jgi:hypothetical protein
MTPNILNVAQLLNVVFVLAKSKCTEFTQIADCILTVSVV